MTKPKNISDQIGEILPDQIYRVSLSPAIFGYGSESTKAKIRSGELPPPFPLSPSSRFEAWTGRQILDHRARMSTLAAQRIEAERVEAASAAKRSQPEPLARALNKRRRPAREQEPATS